MKTAVVGGSGYGGGELLRLLSNHPEFDVAVITGGRAASERVGAVFPSLRGTAYADMVLAESRPEAVAGCDLVFLATPAGVSMALAPVLLEDGARVVDLSAAFRLAPQVYEQWYGAGHTAPELTPAPYGLPEWFHDELDGARLIAGPGCSVTAALLALLPLTGLVDPSSATVAVMTGVSGAGRGLRDDLHSAHAMANVAAYGAPTHRHTPEMEDLWRRGAGAQGVHIDPLITFVPHLVPMARGLVATVTAQLAQEADGAVIHSALDAAYDQEPFVSVVSEWPATAHVLGGNSAHVHAEVDARANRVIVSCAIDNMMKGAAGQALQAANVAAGIDEQAGLSAVGVYP